MSTLRRLSLFTFPASVFTACFLVSTTFAAGADSKKAELHGLKRRIETLRRNLGAAEESKTYAADQLRETESAISDTNRLLHQLATERTELQRQLADLDAQRQRLERQAGAQQHQLALLLNHQFVGADSEALSLLLSGRDPNQAARDAYFLTQLSRAKADLIQQLRAVATEKKRLTDAARGRQAQLAEIERRQQESRAQLVERKKLRQKTLASIASRIQAQRREIGGLTRDQLRLTRVIEGLARGAAKKKTTSKALPPGVPTPGRSVAATRAAVQARDPGDVGGAFAELRGRLRLPVSGTIAGRFGAPRAEGGANWKGIFIRAADGAEVKAVAAGTVVFADWLRGFGNLLIIDHGDDFLSVYGNNESLLAAVGTSVKDGAAVATVGNSGGNPDSGLYFELRHRGQPFDPLKWAANR